MYTSKNISALSNCSRPSIHVNRMDVFLSTIFGSTGTQPENGINFFKCLNI